jgi:hypothetical protein
MKNSLGEAKADLSRQKEFDEQKEKRAEEVNRAQDIQGTSKDRQTHCRKRE